MQQVKSTGNLDRVESTTIFSITEEAKEATLDLSQGTVRVT